MGLAVGVGPFSCREIPLRPAGDGGLDVVGVPLQGATALSASPTAEVPARPEHAPQSQPAKRFAAHLQLLAGGRGADPR
jgi:hypothetical protein